MSENNEYDNADRYFQNTDTGIYIYTLNPEVYKDVCREMQSFANQQYTYQQQTIERLRHIVKIILERSEKNRNHIEVWGNYHLLTEAKNLVNTTEPIDQ